MGTRKKKKGKKRWDRRKTKKDRKKGSASHIRHVFFNHSIDKI